MKKNLPFIYGGVLLSIVVLACLSFNSKNSSKQNIANENNPSVKKMVSQEKQPVDKLEIFLFHNTQRCISCVTIGKYTKKTIEEKFSNEYASGKIVFKEINLDLPENESLGEKFQATGSALFINAISNKQNTIKENTRVWRLVSNEKAFIDYLSTTINDLL